MAKKVKVGKTGLPNKVYVYYEDDDPDNVFLMACETAYETAELGKSRLVGVYELKETVLVELEVAVNQI